MVGTHPTTWQLHPGGCYWSNWMNDYVWYIADVPYLKEPAMTFVMYRYGEGLRGAHLAGAGAFVYQHNTPRLGLSIYLHAYVTRYRIT